MADRSGRVSGFGLKPVPMKLFATWEVEKSSPNCIPRLCTLTLTRLVIHKSLENELQSVIIAVKMQNSKRVLRSNEIIVASNGLLDTELDLSFSLQYPHFLKRDGNKLQVMIQRRKKYKNRTILGYKTLAMGQVNMAQVLQRSVDKELPLYSDPKDRTSVVARVVMLSLTSQPVDHDDRKKMRSSDADRSPDAENSDEDDLQEDPYSSNDDLSDSDAVVDDRATRVRRFMKVSMGRQQRNIKQKFIALLKRFKVSEEVLDSEQDQDGADDRVASQQDIEDLFDELENISESDPEVDTISILSTPKPKLKPFFTGKNSSDALVIDSNLQTVNGHAKEMTARHSDDGSSTSNRHKNDSGSGGGSNKKENSSTKINNTTESDTNVDLTEDEELEVFGCSDAAFTPSLSHREDSPLLQQQQFSSSADTSPRTPPPHSRPSPHLSKVTKVISEMASVSPKLKRDKVKHVRLPKQGSIEIPVEEPRKALLDQLSKVLSSEDSLPESLILVNSSEWQGQMLCEALKEPEHHVIATASTADVKATISSIVNKIQKFCNTNSRAPAPMKIGLAGSDSYLNSVLWPYTEQFSTKSPDWQNYIKFLIVPLGTCTVGKYLSQIDSQYNSLFNDTVWKDTFEKSEHSHSTHTDLEEVCRRVDKYMSESSHLLQLPVAEAMLTYCKDRDKGSEEESSQIFVPFLGEVRVGPVDISGISTSVDLEEVTPLPQSAAAAAAVFMSSSPPQNSCPAPSQRDTNTPPSSPNVNTCPSPFIGGHSGHSGGMMSPPAQPSTASTSMLTAAELLDLQVDYWMTSPASTATGGTRHDPQEKTERLVKKDSKASLKCSFRSIMVYRFPQSVGLTGEISAQSLQLLMITKEKKQKIMRIGKKSKDPESKSQLIESVQRLICTTKSQSQPIKVTIDGVEWFGVKFFQISAQWQTHIKHFPVLVFGHERYDTGL